MIWPSLKIPNCLCSGNCVFWNNHIFNVWCSLDTASERGKVYIYIYINILRDLKFPHRGFEALTIKNRYEREIKKYKKEDEEFKAGV